MSPGGRFCEVEAESHITLADSDATTSFADLRTSPFRKVVPGLNGNAGMPLNKNVHDLLECPVCMNLMCPPIHQCPNGHTLCSSCKTQVQNCCPTCRNELGNIRCLALEKVAESLDVPCRYQIYGCPDIFPYYSKLKHEKVCKCRPYNCPYAGAECAVTGDIQFLMMHLKNDHKVDMHDGSTFNHRYVKSNPQEVENATWMLTLLMEGYTAKIVCSGEGVAFCFGREVQISDFSRYVREHFSISNKNVLKFRYRVHPDLVSYRLECDADLKMMFELLERQNSVFVDLDVGLVEASYSSRGGSESVTNDWCESENGSESFVESEFLGVYRREEPKKYFSNGWENLIMGKGQKFQGGAPEFRTKLRMFAVEKGFVFKFVRNTGSRIVVECAEKAKGCGWYIKASLLHFNGYFHITDSVNSHTCQCVIRTQKNKMLNSNVIKSIIADKLRENPNKKATDIKLDIKSDFGLDVSYRMAWYGKERARESILGSDSDSYKHLLWFAEKAMEYNPGTIVRIDYEPITNRFCRIFVCYDSWLKGFQSCRPILFVDATFLTSKFKGQLLAASAKDADQGLYLVAYAIVDSETEDNWLFFLNCLSEALSNFPERKLTFVSDRNAGLLSALPNAFPESPHGFCYRHLYDNLIKKYPYNSPIRKSVASKFMCVAYSRTPEMYERNLAKLLDEGGSVVADFLRDLPKETWCSAFFDGERYGEMTNNLAECFNSWICDLKSLPIYELNEAIRMKSMQKIVERKEQSMFWTTRLCPRIEQKLKENMETGAHWPVLRCDTSVYEIQCKNFRVTVDLDDEFSCSCGEWKFHCFPCSHALVAIQRHGDSVYSYVRNYFTVDNYREIYSHTIHPIPSISMHHDVEEQTFVLYPPATKRPPGRPRTRRFRSKSELTRHIRCSRCGNYDGHNRASCKAPI